MALIFSGTFKRDIRERELLLASMYGGIGYLRQRRISIQNNSPYPYSSFASFLLLPECLRMLDTSS